MKRVILDVDTGVDDAFALSLALASKKLDLLAVTTVYGNASLDNVIDNTFSVLHTLNRLDIPVYKGSKSPLSGNERRVDNAHGTDGFGDLNLVKTFQKTSGNAIDYLTYMVNTYPNEITIITCGPLTNIASCLLNDQTFGQNLKSLIIMGGSLNGGNITKDAEFNFYNDSKAASIVFQSDINDIKVIGWDTSVNVFLPKDIENKLQSSKSKINNLLYDISRKNADFDKQKGRGGAILSDPLVVAFAIDNSIFKFKKVSIDVETKGTEKGKCYISSSNKKISFATDIDKDKFYKLFKKLLKI